MTKLDIRRIIIRYINHEATQEELSILYEWVKKGNNDEVFKKFVQADFLVNYQDKSWDSEAAFEDFLRSIKKNESKGVRSIIARPHVWKYAAAVVVIVASSLFFFTQKNVQDNIAPPIDPNMITLQLENGEVISLDPDTDVTLKSKTGNAVISLVHGVLSQESVTDEKEIGKENILRVPYGKKLSVTLQDGSVVMLNSGSSLVYPNSFEGMDQRVVQLNGEAFFEVAKNPEQPFIVRTKGMYTQVFGTVFNVAAYEEDGTEEVVLVEGSVGVGKPNSDEKAGLQMMEPSQKLAKSAESDTGFVLENVDVTPYISWTKGILAFENEAMTKIIKRLERQYNIQIVNQNETLGERRFTGMFDVEDIDHVLRTIQAHTNFSYEKQGKIIMIKPNKQ
ncbi:FecR family protein [Flagellimonas beolgyonensis]|uniref:FecR family protein n=1 Tax=Flagellimonas beolgyonensis TaxID=864064 RepID=UPI000F8D6104|nr:FecR domain-containing protein [Allomuricauda beolgyonensis]